MQRGPRERRSTELTQRDDLAPRVSRVCGDERPRKRRATTLGLGHLRGSRKKEILVETRNSITKNKKRKRRTDTNRKMDENRQRELRIFKSLNSRNESFVKFINTTPHTITLYWMDYQGQAINYGDLSPGDFREINTFQTHPWIFVNRETGVRYLVNQCDVFFPAPWFRAYLGINRNAVHELPQRIERTNVYIVLPMFTLQQLSMRVIKNCLTYDSQAFLLDIPRSLQLELSTMLPRKPGLS